MSNILNGIPEVGTLTIEQENQLAGGDEAARETLILANLREAVHYLKGSAKTRSLSDGELLSAAYEGLQAAVVNFQPDRIRFFAYAKAFVRGAASKARRAHNVVKRVRDTEPLPVEPTEDEVEDGELPCPQIIPSELPPCELPDYEGLFARDEWARILPRLRKILGPKQRAVLELHYLGGLNLREIADMLGVTRSDIQHTKQVALRMLRNRMSDYNDMLDR